MTSRDVNYGTRITLPSPAVHKKDQLQVRIDSQRLRKNEAFLEQKNLPELSELYFHTLITVFLHTNK